MKTASARKRSSVRRSTTSHKPVVSSIQWLVIVSCLVLVSVIGSVALKRNVGSTVLGLQSGRVLIARGGDDGGGDSGGDHGGDSGGGSSSGSGSSGGSGGGGGSSSGGEEHGSNDSHNGADSSGQRGSQTGSTAAASTSPSTKVDCIGPDGKHFLSSFKDCQTLNSGWGNSNWSFNPLPSQRPSAEKPRTGSAAKIPFQMEQVETQEQPEPSHRPEKEEKHAGEKTDQQAPELLPLESEHGSDLDQEGSHSSGRRGDTVEKPEQKGKDRAKVQFKIENHEIVASEVHDDGKESELDAHEAFASMNEALRDQEVEISTASGNQVRISKHGIHAETELSLSVDGKTHELQVETKNGGKPVTLSPDLALTQAVQTDTISQVDATSGTAPIELALQDNVPVFKIKGSTDRKVLGVFSKTFHKTAFIDADSGDILQVDEAFIDRMLEHLSF